MHKSSRYCVLIWRAPFIPVYSLLRCSQSFCFSDFVALVRCFQGDFSLKKSPWKRCLHEVMGERRLPDVEPQKFSHNEKVWLVGGRSSTQTDGNVARQPEDTWTCDHQDRHLTRKSQQLGLLIFSE